MSQGFLQRLPYSYPRLLASARLQADRVSGRPMLLYPEGVVVLNATAEAVLRLCDGTRSFGEILEQLAEQYQVSRDTLEIDVSVYLFGLYQQNLLHLVTEGEQKK